MAARDDLYRQFRPELIEALILVLLDENNVHRGWIMDFKVEIAAATNLADLQARVAGLPDLADRTPAQLITSINNKLATVDDYDYNFPD